MAQAVRDNNRVTAMLGVSSVDGITPVPMTVDPSTGRLRVHATGKTSDPLNPAVLEPVKRDQNRVTDTLAQTSTGTAVPLTVGDAGSLRINNL